MSQDKAPVAPLTEAEEQSIRTLYRAFSENNPDLVDEACASDWQDIPMVPGQEPGPAGLKPLIHGFLRAFPDMNITVHEIIGVAGRAGVRAEITGTHQGEFMGIAPTGKAISVPIHEFHHFQDGRITHTWHLEDWFGMLHQVGAWPPPAHQEEVQEAK